MVNVLPVRRPSTAIPEAQDCTRIEQVKAAMVLVRPVEPVNCTVVEKLAEPCAGRSSCWSIHTSLVWQPQWHSRLGSTNLWCGMVGAEPWDIGGISHPCSSPTGDLLT